MTNFNLSIYIHYYFVNSSRVYLSQGNCILWHFFECGTSHVVEIYAILKCALFSFFASYSYKKSHHVVCFVQVPLQLHFGIHALHMFEEQYGRFPEIR